jgi:DNA-binding HxlR family transcriptional regulator
MDEDCLVYNALEIFSRRWTLLVVLSIYKGKREKKRYSEIKKDLSDITGKILSARLKELEKEGILKRELDKKSIPLKITYSLTEKGKVIIPIIQSVKEWGIKWDNKHGKGCAGRLCKHCLE